MRNTFKYILIFSSTIIFFRVVFFFLIELLQPGILIPDDSLFYFSDFDFFTSSGLMRLEIFIVAVLQFFAGYFIYKKISQNLLLSFSLGLTISVIASIFNIGIKLFFDEAVSFNFLPELFKLMKEDLNWRYLPPFLLIITYSLMIEPLKYSLLSLIGGLAAKANVRIRK